MQDGVQHAIKLFPQVLRQETQDQPAVLLQQRVLAPVATVGIGVGQVVKGWDQALVGQTAGSRVVLAIPPALGYGKGGNEQARIKGTDTLYFVVDILGVA